MDWNLQTEQFTKLPVRKTIHQVLTIIPAEGNFALLPPRQHFHENVFTPCKKKEEGGLCNQPNLSQVRTLQTFYFETRTNYLMPNILALEFLRLWKKKI